MRRLNLIVKYIFTLGFWNFINYLFQRFLFRKKIISIKLPKLKDPVFIRNNASDIQIFTQIFISQEYNTNINHEVKIIIDCGANIGMASLYFISKYKYAKIIALEPEPENFEMLERNVRHYPNIQSLNKGIWNKRGYLDIIDNGWGNAGFVVEETNVKSNNSIEAISLDQLVAEYKLPGIDILKMDIEGSEEQVFLNTDLKWVKMVKTLFLEIHENLKPGLTFRIENLLQSDFDSHKSGEYYVFERKIQQP